MRANSYGRLTRTALGVQSAHGLRVVLPGQAKGATVRLVRC